MVTLDPRRLLLLLALQPALIGCAVDEPEADQLDVDGEGKEDAATSSDPNRLLDVPFYFSMPKGVVTTTLNRAAYPYPTVWNSSLQSSDIGLRVIAIQRGSTLESK